MAKPHRRLHVILHARWYREGARPFQELRLDLVRLLDGILADLALSPSDSFLLDGQSILVEDYLEVRPERREEVIALVESQQLYLGPWYIFPNEFLVSPEALVRNLALGTRTALQLGARLETGYLPDGAGHIGQMPQLLQGFGLESAAITWGAQVQPPISQWWIGPDDSKLLLATLCEDIGSAGTILDDPQNVITKHKRRSETQTLAILCDTQDEEIADVLASLKAGTQAAEIIASTLPAYLMEIREQSASLPTLTGEILPALPPAGTFSARMWTKQRNHRIQILLEHWAEPFGIWSQLVQHAIGPARKDGLAEKPGNLTAHAWRILLPNHAHPSISGLASDEVHNEMRERFEQAEQIGEAITNQSLRYLASKIDTTSITGNDDTLCSLVFNAAAQPQTGIVTLEIPPELADRPFQIMDPDGASLPVETLQENEETPVPQPVRVSFVARDVPAYGYRTYSLVPTDTPLPRVEINDGYTIENEYLNVTLDSSEGTITLFDKETGRSFEGLNRYADGGDCGDAAAYCPPPRDTVIDIATNMPLYADRYVSDVQQQLRYLQIYRLPQMLTPQRDARLPLAAQFVPISIMTTLRLTAGVARLDVETSISNGALDHRLRAHFPTGVRAQEILIDGHFAVDTRAVPGVYSQRAFATAQGSDTGLTVTSWGLPEIAAEVSSEGTDLIITLLRSVGWLQAGTVASAPIYTPDAQCRGTYHFTYSLIPHGKNPLPAWQQAWASQIPLRGLITSRHPGVLPPEHSLVTVNNPVFVLSAVKAAADNSGLIVRGYNVSSKPEKVVLKLGVEVEQAQFARIDETPIGPILKPDSRGRYRFEARPAEIVTLHFATS
jgi:mannosylglycerate hydrolase